MADYSSVRNTAKNGQLIRAEVREMALAIAIAEGFRHDEEFAREHYPDDLRRQKQCTLLAVLTLVKADPEPDEEENLCRLWIWAKETLKCFFKHEEDSLLEDDSVMNICCTKFYDTKRLRIYAKRMEYGRYRQIRLDKATMQYFWTKLPLALWYEMAKCKDENVLDFARFEAMLRPKSIEENMRAVSAYISDICGIPNDYDPENGRTRLHFSSENSSKLKETCIEEALRIKQKLYDGAYIDLTEEEKKDIDTEGYDYGKKSREKYREANLARKAGKNQAADRQGQRVGREDSSRIPQ